MKYNKAFNYHLVLILLVLISSILWAGYSWWLEFNCLKSNGWFARSGAIIVIAAIFTGLITQPFVSDFTFPDLVNIYEHAKGESELKEPHWAAKINLPKILLIVELGIGIIGTVIWAYGDLWIQKCN